jgi:hypothetical protein
MHSHLCYRLLVWLVVDITILWCVSLTGLFWRTSVLFFQWNYYLRIWNLWSVYWLPKGSCKYLQLVNYCDWNAEWILNLKFWVRLICIVCLNWNQSSLPFWVSLNKKNHTA